MNIDNTEIQILEEDDEPEYASPQGSKWIVAVSDEGYVSVLVRPPIHHAFFDNGPGAEDIGLPFEVENPAGVYEWICNVQEYRDWESGYVDDWNFDVIKETLLFRCPGV